MKVVLTETLDLLVYTLPFELWFKFKPKRGIKNIHWFTPKGKCNVWVGGCNNDQLGKLEGEDYANLILKMSRAKTDLLTDGRYFYTTGDKNIIRINNMDEILEQIDVEWEGRKYIEFWVEDDREI